MKLLDVIEVTATPHKRIELLQGDLTNIPPKFSVDLLIVSAFPNRYTPTRSSLIGALYRKGLVVSALAANKERDLRRDFSCWLSQKFTPPTSGLGFSRVLCFEPIFRGNPPEVVGDIFRALTPILAEKPEIASIAMPIVAAGDQGHTVSSMLIPLLDASLHWMEQGLPLNIIRVVAYSDQQTKEAAKEFSRKKRNYLTSKTAERKSADFDVFISYAHENSTEMELFEGNLLEKNPDIRIFLDRKQIDIGTAWQPEIFESLDRCRKVVAMFSPDYLNSKVCKEEFNIAWVRSRETELNILFPIYIYTAELPTYMKYRNYYDCREGDATKIAEASGRLIESLYSP